MNQCNKSKYTCKTLKTDAFVDENCGLGRRSKLNDLKYIIDPALPCDTAAAPCQHRENCLEKSRCKCFFPTIIGCEEVGFIIYLLYALFSTFTILYTYAPVFWLTNEVDKHFIDKEIEQSSILNNFRTITNTSEFWKFLDINFLNNKYWIRFLENEPVNYATTDSFLFGVPRLRQARSERDSLKNHCIEIEKEIFLDNAKSRCADIIDLSTNRNLTLSIINNLKSSSWISKTTKSLYLTFTIYNVNINYFCIVKLIFDRPVTGGIITNKLLYTVRLLPYVTMFDHIVLGCQIFFVMLIFYFTIVEIIKMFIYKKYYWMKFRSYVTLSQLCLAIVCIIMHIISLGWAKRIIHLQKDHPGKHVDFTRIGAFIVQIHVFSGILLFLIWFQIFQYVKYIYPLNILNIALARNKRVLFGFVMNFLLVFISFALLGLLLFGSQVVSFSKFEYSLFSLLKTLMGEFVFEEIRNANGYWGYTFFIVFIIVVFCMLMNLLIAIIGENYYEATKYEECREKTCRKYCLRSKCCRRKKRKGTTNLIKLLKTCSYTDTEICEAFKKYNLDPCMDISKQRINKFLTELLINKYNFYEAASYVRENHTNKIYITLEEYESQEAELSRLARNIEMLCCRINNKMNP